MASHNHAKSKKIQEQRDQQAKLQSNLDQAVQKSKYLKGQLARVQEQLTQTPVRGMADLPAASTVADNYWPCGTGPKNQLTETDVAVYAPWKWAMSKKLRIDTVIYSSKMDQISYAFS